MNYEARFKVIQEASIQLSENIQQIISYSNYVIEMHALKSSARLIGADEFSELAKELEFAGKENNLVLIDEKTETIFEWYDRIKSDLSRILK